MKELVKKFYIKKYPTDDLGVEINNTITFEDVYNKLKAGEGEEIYDLIGVGDSLIRERIFGELSDRLGVDYDTIYDLWLGKKTESYKESFEYLSDEDQKKEAKNILSKYVSFDEVKNGEEDLSYVKDQLQSLMAEGHIETDAYKYIMDNFDSLSKSFLVTEDTTIEYDNEAADKFKDTFRVASEQETADAMGKEVVNKRTHRRYQPKKVEEGALSHADKLSSDELRQLEKDLYAKLDAEGIHPEDGTFYNSTNRIADIELVLTINGDWKHDHLYADELAEEFWKAKGYTLLNSSENVIGDSDSDWYRAEHKYILVKDTDGQMADRIDGFRRLFGENLNESSDRDVLSKVGSYEIIKDGYGFGIDDGTTVNRFFVDNDGVPHFDYEPTNKMLRKAIDKLVKSGKLDNPNYKGDDAKFVGNTLKYGRGVEESVVNEYTYTVLDVEDNYDENDESNWEPRYDIEDPHSRENSLGNRPYVVSWTNHPIGLKPERVSRNLFTDIYRVDRFIDGLRDYRVSDIVVSLGDYLNESVKINEYRDVKDYNFDRNDFTYKIDSFGYSVFYKGEFVSGAGVDKDHQSRRNWKSMKKDRKDNKNSAEVEIKHIMSGIASDMIYDRIDKILNKNTTDKGEVVSEASIKPYHTKEEDDALKPNPDKIEYKGEMIPVYEKGGFWSDVMNDSYHKVIDTIEIGNKNYEIHKKLGSYQHDADKIFAMETYREVDEDMINESSRFSPTRRTAIDGKEWWVVYDNKEKKYTTLLPIGGKYKTKKDCQYAIDRFIEKFPKYESMSEDMLKEESADRDKEIARIESEIAKKVDQYKNSMKRYHGDNATSKRLEGEIDGLEIELKKLKSKNESLKEDKSSEWMEVSNKSVQDSDGFYTDYTWYTDGNRHVFVFGDSDIYKPEDGEFDWEVEIYPGKEEEAYEEAQEWFNGYKGFDDDVDESLNESHSIVDKVNSFRKKYPKAVWFDNGKEVIIRDTKENERRLKEFDLLDCATLDTYYLHDSEHGYDIFVIDYSTEYDTLSAKNADMNESLKDKIPDVEKRSIIATLGIEEENLDNYNIDDICDQYFYLIGYLYLIGKYGEDVEIYLKGDEAYWNKDFDKVGESEDLVAVKAKKIDEAVEDNLTIEYWVDENARDYGEGDLYVGKIKDIADAKRIADRLFGEYASVEVIKNYGTEDEEVVYGRYPEDIDEAVEDNITAKSVVETPRGNFKLYQGTVEDFDNEEDRADWGIWFQHYPEDRDDVEYTIFHNYKKQHAIAVKTKDAKADKIRKVEKWWSDVEKWNSENGSPYTINNGDPSDEDYFDSMVAAMFDMVRDLKGKDEDLYKRGRRLYNMYAPFSSIAESVEKKDKYVYFLTDGKDNIIGDFDDLDKAVKYAENSDVVEYIEEVYVDEDGFVYWDDAEVVWARDSIDEEFKRVNGKTYSEYVDYLMTQKKLDRNSAEETARSLFEIEDQGVKTKFPSNRKINVQESLKVLDYLTDRKYNLLETYESRNLSEDKKLNIAKLIFENASAEKIYDCLVEGLFVEDEEDNKISTIEKNTSLIGNAFFARKPSSIEEIVTAEERRREIDPDAIGDDYRIITSITIDKNIDSIGKLNSFAEKYSDELISKDTNSYYDRNVLEIKTPSGRWLIDTQGYDYARYVAFVKEE